jgi:hypothetical protein
MDSRGETARASALPTKLASSAPASFHALPKGIRNDIYKKVLSLSHPIYLFQEPGSRVESFVPEKPARWLALLYTNRQIYHEASASLYRTNQFYLVDTTQQQSDLLISFLDCVGPVHASSLSYLCINFPVVERTEGQSGQVKLKDDSLQTLGLLRDKCSNLSTLETLVHHKNDIVFRKEDDTLQEVVSSIDAQLKTIPSLQKIIVRFAVRDRVPSTLAKEHMQRLGWVIVSDRS